VKTATESTRALLLVEDNPADADLVTEFLERTEGTSYRILLASRVDHALRQLRESQVDVVLLDLRLPDGSGVETVKAVLSEADQGTPVIVLTGTDDEALALSCIDAGADDYLYKGDIQPNLLHRSIGYSITRRREMQSRQRQVQRLVASSPDAVVVTDAAGVVRFANEAAFGLFGRKRANFLGDNFPFAVEDGQVEEIEIERSGSRRRAEMRVARIEWEGADAFLASIRDNTEQKQLEEKFRQAQKLEAIGRLAGGVAHDFNNLLTVILASVEVIEERTSDPAILRPARDIATAGDRAASLTRQLMTFGRQSAASPTPVDLNDLVRESERLLRRVIGEDIVLDVSLANALPRVVVDPTNIAQTIMNLAVNARDAMPHGGRLGLRTDCVRLDEEPDRTQPGWSAGEYVRLVVSDTGTGMDAATQARIFEPFFTTKAPGKGTGLGLATVYGIVRQCGGRIAVESSPGAGTRFTVHLPAAPPGEAAGGPREPSEDEATQGATVLLVEDSETVRVAAASMLRRMNYRVLEAQSGEEAVEKARNLGEDFDLLLTDILMPGMGGIQAARAIRSLLPGLPIVFMSGYFDQEGTDRGTPLPNTVFLRKPFTGETLRHALRQAMARKSGGK